MKSPIRVFSDLHLAHPGCRIESVEHLAPLFEGAGTVIFNGDTCEQRRTDWADDGKAKLEALRALLERCGVEEAIFLRGNHDPFISETDHLELADGRVLVTHGDAIFPHISPWSAKIWLLIPEIESIRAEYDSEKLASDLETVLECTHRCRNLNKDSGDEFDTTGPFAKIRSLLRIAWPPRRPLKILHTWATIPRDAHDFLARVKPSSQVMLFGHTHFPGTWNRDARIAVNTGGFMSFMPARGVEISGGEIEVFAIEESDRSVRRGKSLNQIEIS